MEYLDFLLNSGLKKYLDSIEYIDKRDKERYKYLVKCLDKSIVQLYEKDFVLLKNDVHEQSISHKLAHYLQNNIEEEKTGLFEEFSVDCEYNKNKESIGKEKIISNTKDSILYALKTLSLDDKKKEKARKIIEMEDFFSDENIKENIEKLKKIFTKRFLKENKEEMKKFFDQIRKLIRPDIIVHEREKNENNLLVIEIKKMEFNKDLVKLEEEESDIEKLKKITSSAENGNLKYKFGIFINFGNNSENKKEISFRIVLIINGREVTHWICQKNGICQEMHPSKKINILGIC